MILFIFIFTISYLLFIESYVGSIMFRYNSDNILSFNLWSGLNFLVHPLYNLFLWNKETLIMNYPFMLGCFIIVMIIYKKFDFLRYHSLSITDGILKRFNKDSTPKNP
jgi:hypothetical protein